VRAIEVTKSAVFRLASLHWTQATAQKAMVLHYHIPAKVGEVSVLATKISIG